MRMMDHGFFDGSWRTSQDRGGKPYILSDEFREYMRKKREANPMTTPERLGELAERCEAATGFNNRLNWDIANAVLPSAICRPPEADADEYSVLSFTSSIDAAMKLVPAGHDMQINLFAGRDGEGSASVSPLKKINLPRTFAATPALALCAAALRARIAQGGDND